MLVSSSCLMRLSLSKCFGSTTLNTYSYSSLSKLHKAAAGITLLISAASATKQNGAGWLESQEKHAKDSSTPDSWTSSQLGLMKQSSALQTHRLDSGFGTRLERTLRFTS